MIYGCSNALPSCSAGSVGQAMKTLNDQADVDEVVHKVNRTFVEQMAADEAKAVISRILAKNGSRRGRKELINLDTECVNLDILPR